MKYSGRRDEWAAFDSRHRIKLFLALQNSALKLMVEWEEIAARHLINSSFFLSLLLAGNSTKSAKEWKCKLADWFEFLVTRQEEKEAGLVWFNSGSIPAVKFVEKKEMNSLRQNTLSGNQPNQTWNEAGRIG